MANSDLYPTDSYMEALARATPTHPHMWEGATRQHASLDLDILLDHLIPLGLSDTTNKPSDQSD